MNWVQRFLDTANTAGGSLNNPLGSGFYSLRGCITFDTLGTEVKKMPTRNPRVNVVLEGPLYQGLCRWAKRDGVSLSLKVRDLVKEALDAEEDRLLTRFAETREKSFDRNKAMSHDQVWSRLRRSRR